MNRFSKKSRDALYTCDLKLIVLFEEVLPIHDCTILEGHRSEKRQLELYDQGLSRIPRGGPHNEDPSRAIDVAPYPVDWENIKRFYYFAGIVMGHAHQLGFNIRWGGDWNSNNNLDDQAFFDLVHWELE